MQLSKGDPAAATAHAAAGADGAPSARAEGRLRAGALALLLLITVLAYRPVADLGFFALDDRAYVLENPHVHAGLVVETLAWSLRATESGNWHPLTWLSHALDWQLFGAWAGGHHLTNLALHVANVALVFWAFRALTGAAWSSLAVAGLFALHPMNVESVAWIAERKNVLSGTFYACTLLAYARYARRPTLPRYLAVTAAYGLGLMAKPMLVTIPFVLLLLDLWPLRRHQTGSPLRSLLWEKLPWLAMTAASSAVTLHAQAAGGAVVTAQEYPLSSRACNALVGYLEYVLKLLWPSGLAVFYQVSPNPCLPPRIVAALVVLLPLSVGSVLYARRQPAAAVGWAWFLGMLVPVCGLVQVGSQSMANRYVYHPMLGAAVALVFGLLPALPARIVRALPALAVACCAALAWRTSEELRYWRDDETLFRRGLAVTGKNCTAELQLGVALRNRGDLDGARDHWGRALRECPDMAAAHEHLGALLARRGELAAAIPHFSAAATLDATAAPAMHYNIGLALLGLGRPQEARAQFERALALDPGHAPSRDMIQGLGVGPPR